MAATGKDKKKYLFFEEDEEGELTDSDDEGKNEKEAKVRRVEDFISEWSEKVQQRKNKEAEEKEEMDIASDEDTEAVIETEPLAMSVTIRDETFGRSFFKYMFDVFVNRFGPKIVRFQENCLSIVLVKPEQSSSNDEKTKNVASKEETEKNTEDKSVETKDNAKISGNPKDAQSNKSDFISLSTDLKQDESIPHSETTEGIKTDSLNESNCDSSVRLPLQNSSGLESVAVLFYDKEFCDKHFDFVQRLCEGIFGEAQVTTNSGVIEIAKNDLVDFEVDTSRHGYNQNIRYTVPEDGMYVEEGSQWRRGRGLECFNCGGPHNLQACPKPHDYKIINANRAKMRDRKLQLKARYHSEKEKYSGLLAPGLVSADLREALGLSDNQIPRHVYKMRHYGYPPGWLQEAKIAHSGVVVYGVDGAVPEDGDEDGQVFEEGEKDKYDMKKLIKFPGFNTPLDPHVEEESDKFDCPPFMAEQDIGLMIERLAPNAYEAYKRRRMINEANSIEEDAENSVDSDSEKEQLNSTAESAKGSPKPCDPSTPTTLCVTPVTQSTPCVTPGTPVLPSASPYSCLPSREKFSVNISDLEFFQNLPNATGTYKQVATTLAKVREYVKNS